jgi:hypothetical protein
VVFFVEHVQGCVLVRGRVQDEQNRPGECPYSYSIYQVVIFGVTKLKVSKIFYEFVNQNFEATKFFVFYDERTVCSCVFWFDCKS